MVKIISLKRMKIKPYTPSNFNKIKTWVTDERTHALWCGGLISYPLNKNNFEKALKEFIIKNGESPFVAITNKGKIIGFFCYSINPYTREGKLKFIIISPQFRNKGYGKEMVTLALKHAFCNSSAESVQLNVFLNNGPAKNCYLHVGFSIRSITKKSFCFNEEMWSKCNMVIKKHQLLDI